ncbi:hypothetical protein BKA57DRAFT_443152 [Linnemannia elongata]|nr:hypothetical protein BKA57DRAFT_443152 [Linnemannia elongata]
MNLQYNTGDIARVYMSKYITKIGSIHYGFIPPVAVVGDLQPHHDLDFENMSYIYFVAIGSDKYLRGVPVVLFGDFGQLAPINKRSDQIDWLWDTSQLYRCFTRYNLQKYVRHNGNDVFSTFLRNLRSWSLTGDAQTTEMEYFYGARPHNEDNNDGGDEMEDQDEEGDGDNNLLGVHSDSESDEQIEESDDDEETETDNRETETYSEKIESY